MEKRGQRVESEGALEGLDLSQGEVSLEAALVKSASLSLPEGRSLNELARRGGLDALLTLPLAKETGRPLPFWAKAERSRAMALARLCLAPGDCSFAKRACAALPGGQRVWLFVVAMLAADAPEALASSGEPGWMSKRQAAAAVLKYMEYRHAGEGVEGAQALIRLGLWAPKKPSDWDGVEDVFIQAKHAQGRAWVASERQRLELELGLAGASAARSAPSRALSL